MDSNLNELINSVKSRRHEREINRRNLSVTGAGFVLSFLVWASIQPSENQLKNKILNEYDTNISLTSKNTTGTVLNGFNAPELLTPSKRTNYRNLVSIIKSKDEKIMVTRVSRTEVLAIINKNGGGEISMKGQTMFVFSSQ